MKAGYNRFRRFAAFTLGIVFTISGLLKLMDPVGSEMMMLSYLKFFHINFLNWAAKTIGVSFSLIETICGVGLITGVYRKFFAIVTTCLISFFSLLTLILLIFNPQMDCGCFGEAFHLTHLQSFIKNIILCVFTIIAFSPMKEFGDAKKIKYGSFYTASAFIIAFMIYSLITLPLKEYTDFKIGAQLQAAANEEVEKFSSVFIYEKDGEQREFDLDNLPDSSWSFVESKISEKQNVFSPHPVLSISDTNGEYCDSIAATGKVLIISSYKKLSDKRYESIQRFADRFNDYFTTASKNSKSNEAVKLLILTHDKTRTFSENQYFSDYKTLATLNRSNGGATLIVDGIIVKKWSFTQLVKKLDSKKQACSFEESINSIKDTASNYVDAHEAANYIQTKRSLIFQGFLLYIFSILLLI